MNSTNPTLQVKVQELYQLARKLTLEKNYEQALGAYNQTITILSKVSKESNNQQKNELIQTITKKIREDMKKVEELKKGNGKEQFAQEKDDQTMCLEIEDNIVADLENVFQDYNHETVQEEEEETKLVNQSKFQRDCYPNANEYLISLIQDLEKKIIEPDADIRLDDIISLGDSKKMTLQDSIVLPLLYPQVCVGSRFFCNCVLIAGHQAEKMKTIHALAHESKARLLILSVSDLVANWPHNGERIFKIIFQICRYYAPLIMYLEGLEAFGIRQDPDRDNEGARRMKTEFLVQCQGVSSFGFEVENPETKAKEYKPFMVIGSSEYPSALDRAVLRRLEMRIYLNLLTKEDRRKFFQTNLEQSNAKIGEDVNWEYIIKHTEYYSPDDIASVCREAVMASRRIKCNEMVHSDRGIKELNKNKSEEIIVTNNNFVNALRRISRSILEPELEFYKNYIE